MRLYLTRKERDELRSLQSSYLSILNDERASDEQKEIASEQVQTITGALLSPLFPTGIVRKRVIGWFCCSGPYSRFLPRTIGCSCHSSLLSRFLHGSRVNYLCCQQEYRATSIRN